MAYGVHRVPESAECYLYKQLSFVPPHMPEQNSGTLRTPQPLFVEPPSLPPCSAPTEFNITQTSYAHEVPEARSLQHSWRSDVHDDVQHAMQFALNSPLNRKTKIDWHLYKRQRTLLHG